MRRPLTPTEKIIYNNGERLIFGISHNVNEDIRHRSSYIFFKKIIDNDLIYIKSHKMKINAVNIIDLGCGVGHGCETLSEIKNSTIMGVDSCQEAINYAKDVYPRDNISYKCLDLRRFIPIMPSYDYVISSQVLEHIPNGLELGFSSKWLKRLMLAVPYNEPKNRNLHHVLSDIREDNFSDLNTELFYQDLAGIIYDKNNKPPNPNTIICVCTHPTLSNITNNQISFPVPAWEP